MAGSPGGTRTASGAGGSGGGDRGKRPMPPSGKAKGKGKGKLHCVLCQTMTDHCATECPYNVCHRCGERGHWVRSCTSVVCDWCHKKDHYMKDCPDGGANYVKGAEEAARTNKRSADSVPEGGKVKVMRRSGTLTPGVSYSKVVATPKDNAGSASSSVGKSEGKEERPFLVKVSDFLRDVAESGGVLDQDTVAARRLALEARRREVEAQYRRAMARIDADEAELDAEVEHEAQFQQALNHLASLKAKVVGRRGKGKDSSRAPSTSTKTVHSEELPVVQSVQPIPVVSTDLGASTQPTEGKTSVEEREDAQTVQSSMTRSDDSKVRHSHQLENEDTCTSKCEDQAEVKARGEVGSQSGGIHTDPGGGESPLGEEPDDQSSLGERSGGDDGMESKEEGEEGEISEAGESELSVGVLFDKLDMH